MKKSIYKFKEFKLLLEREGDEEEDNFDFSAFGEDDEDDQQEGDQQEGEESPEDQENFDSEGGEGDLMDEEEEDVEEEESPRKLFEEDPSYYINQAIEKVKRKILSFFEKPEPNEKGRVNNDTSSYYSQGVEVMDVKKTDLPMSKTLIVKYNDSEYMYHLMVTIDLSQGIPKEDDEVASTDMIEYCGVKFKKYDSSNKLLGQLDRQEIRLDNIDQDFIDTLNAELDDKYSIDNDFEIEYGEGQDQE